jgi:hypothetical protein
MTFLKLLLDENVDDLFGRELLRRDTEVVVWSIGAPGAPPKGTSDPQLLIWCEERGFLLVTNNRKSMPAHLSDHLKAKRHTPGIILLNATLSVGANIDELWLIATSGDAVRFEDCITYLPI